MFNVTILVHLIVYSLVAFSQLITSPRNLSVNDVAEIMEKTDLKEYVSLFRDNVSHHLTLTSYSPSRPLLSTFQNPHNSFSTSAGVLKKNAIK